MRASVRESIIGLGETMREEEKEIVAREALRESARRAAKARWARTSAEESSRTMKQVAAHRWNKKARKHVAAELVA